MREATNAAEVSDRVALRKCFRSGPLFSPMPMKVDSRIGWASDGQMAAELSSVERQRMDRPALLGAAGMIGMIVRIVLAEGEFDLGIRLRGSRPSRRRSPETRRRARRRNDCRPRAGCRSAPARWGRRRRRAPPAGCPAPTAIRPSARWCRRTRLPSRRPGHPQPSMMRGNRRGHAGGAGADDQHVARGRLVVWHPALPA